MVCSGASGKYLGNLDVIFDDYGNILNYDGDSILLSMILMLFSSLSSTVLQSF